MHRNIMIMDAVIVVVMVLIQSYKDVLSSVFIVFFVFSYMIWCGLGEWCDCAGDGATVEVRH